MNFVIARLGRTEAKIPFVEGDDTIDTIKADGWTIDKTVVEDDIVEEVEPMKYSTGLILEAIGRMGSDVYDAAKAYMQSNRVNGAVIWDLLVSGDYIEADNPCVIEAREMVIADGICTAEQFDAVLAASVISE